MKLMIFSAYTAVCALVLWKILGTPTIVSLDPSFESDRHPHDDFITSMFLSLILVLIDHLDDLQNRLEDLQNQLTAMAGDNEAAEVDDAAADEHVEQLGRVVRPAWADPWDPW